LCLRSEIDAPARSATLSSMLSFPPPNRQTGQRQRNNIERTQGIPQ
jgi:hypothetical protein